MSGGRQMSPAATAIVNEDLPIPPPADPMGSYADGVSIAAERKGAPVSRNGAPLSSAEPLSELDVSAGRIGDERDHRLSTG